MFTPRDHYWMQQALELAKQAQDQDEVPIGAVLVEEDKLIGQGFNRPITDNDPTAHAEIVALRDAAKNKNNYRLVNSTLYVTLEPCVMCIGAIVHARVKRLVFGAHDPRAGAVESAFQINNAKKLNHYVECCGGLLSQECGNVLVDFFKKRR